MSNKQILVTGGAGFIGSHLVKSLLDEGHVVTCLDNFFTGSRDNIARFLDHPNFELVRHDITEPYYAITCDEIYHLACPASPVHYQSNPVKTMKTAFLGTLNVLGIARRTGAKVLLASTSEVYGDPAVHPQTEEYKGSVNCVGPRACYDEGKRAAEAVAMDYHRMHNIKLSIARIFNTYGPSMAIQDGRVVSNFIWQALNNKPLTIYGSGDQTRSFCYVSDLVEGLIKLMESNVLGPVNLGNPNELSIAEIAEIVKKEVGNEDVKTVYLNLPSDDPSRRMPVITKANQLLNWNPKVPLSEGVRLTVDDFRSRMNSSKLSRKWQESNKLYEAILTTASGETLTTTTPF